MLKRSFNPAKCKTVLRLAVSRIKLLKNKKEAAYKHQKREVAQLLESGQDRTARIRVEHVIREEKTMAAYELIEIYCELIVARLSMVETQKNCPIDMKEAIASVMFASPRCAADIPELLDIRKHFTAKYGKEFVTSAVELRPNSGVNRMLVEKLSGAAPDTQTKIKILTTIAEEHNIKWEPSSGEKDEKPIDDMLSGPKTFESVNKIYVESPVVQASPSFQQKQDVPVNHYEQDRSSSMRSENFASADVGTSKTTPASPHPEPRPSPKSEEMDREHSFLGDGNDFSLGKQNWNMEFKDATSAAQAAAVAAERASMAARAAAELSSRENTRTSYSNESQKSSVYESPDECRPNYTGSARQSEGPAKKSGNNSFHGRTNERTNEHEDEDDEYNLAAEAAKLRSRSKKSSRPASLKSSSVSLADDLPPPVKGSQKNDGYSQMSSPRVGIVKPKSGDYSDEEAAEEKFHEVSPKDADKAGFVDSFVKERFEKQSSRSQKNDGYSQMSSPRVSVVKPKSGDYSDEEVVKEKFHEGSKKQNAYRTGTVDSVVKERFEKQSSGASSRSHLSTFSDHEKFENDVGHGLFGSVSKEDILEDTEHAQFDDHGGQVFDNSDSDDYKGGFDHDVFNAEANFFPSPDRETPTHVSEDTYTSKSISSKSYLFPDADTPEVSISHSKSNVLSESDDLHRVAFDHSDGPSSESEEELVQPKHTFSPKKQISPRIVTSQLNFDEINLYSVNDKFEDEKSSQSSTHSSVHEMMNIVEISETPDEMKDDNFIKLSSFEDNTDSSFGVFTGGRRNKPKLPPYNPRRRSSDTSSDSDSDDFVHVRDSEKERPQLSSVKNQMENSTGKGRVASGIASRRTRPKDPSFIATSYSDEMIKFLGHSGDGSAGSGFGDEKARVNEQERSKPAQESTKERLKTSSLDNPRWTGQASSKPVPEFQERKQEERLKTSAYEKPRPQYQEELYTPARKGRLETISPEKPRSREQVISKYEEDGNTSRRGERQKTSALENPRSREQGRPKYEEEVYTPARKERLETISPEKPRSREKVIPKYEEDVNIPRRGDRPTTSATEKPRSREKVIPKYEEDVNIPRRGDRQETSAVEKPRSREQVIPKYEEDVNIPRRRDRQETSAVEKPRSREQVIPKYEEDVNIPRRGDRQEASAVEKPRSREQASPKYEQEVNTPTPTPTPTREERPKASTFEKPSSPVSEETESLKTSTSTSSEKIPAREDSFKRASHVHPKLPDFDTFTAHFQALRTNKK